MSGKRVEPVKPHYRILLVDDSAAMRGSLRALLLGMPVAEFDILEADHGVAALKLLSDPSQVVDLVITDLTMPQMDGVALIRCLRQLPHLADTPILFLTSHGEEDKKTEVFRLGATDYVLKPFLAPELQARILGYLERKRAFETVRAQERSLQQSIDEARLTQAALLPSSPPSLPGVRIAAKYQPAAHLTGDYYGFYPQSDGSLGIVVADVAGHGIGAALVSFLVAGILEHNAAAGGGPDEVLRRTNAMLSGKLPEARYSTAFYAVYEPKSRRLSYSSAGHPPALLIRAGADQVQRLGLEGSPLGLVAPAKARFEKAEVVLQRGDRLLFHSDALGDGGEAAPSTSFQQIRRFLLDNAARPAAQLLEGLYELGLAGRSQYADDLTMIAVDVL